ncbi:MAG TPA: ATP-binding protein [Candidatus Limnocylindrales bacterium]|nr:ATP-binding protein [Candidatus Limnocylindrales bacterium]
MSADGNPTNSEVKGAFAARVARIMTEKDNFVLDRAAPPSPYPRVLRSLLLPCLGVVLVSLLAAVFLRPGRTLEAFSDLSQLALTAVPTVLAFQNSLKTHSRVRAFWMLIFVGMALWTASYVIWTTQEIWFQRPVPANPFMDILVFVKIVPLTAALAICPDLEFDSRYRAFGILDFSILIVYVLYLYVFAVFAYLLPLEAPDIYNFRFNVADAVGNQVFLIVAGISAVRAQGYWKGLYRICFFGVFWLSLGSVLVNVAIDMGQYYTGGFYDIALVIALVSFLCVPILGRAEEMRGSNRVAPHPADDVPRATTFISSHLAMLVTLSTPLIGYWLLSSTSAPAQLRPFRLVITLLTILLLTLQLSIKLDFLTAGLVGSLERLSETYSRIDRYKTHLAQSEKLATLGELVAKVANQIKDCMTAILGASMRLTSRPDGESRIQSMAGKIGQYAQRTDVLVDNMLHFAQETPLRLAPVEVKPLLESAVHLSRVEKLPKVSVEIIQETECPPVRGDSSQLLHVFLQLISNAMDALEEAGGGSFVAAIRLNGDRMVVEFADSGAGIKEPQRVFEPFYTTKPVGKGTGLGLSTCYGIIQQHAGDIYCRNRAEGGAVFSVVLPLATGGLPQDGETKDLLGEGVR